MKYMVCSIFIAIVFCVAPGQGSADEFFGKLERVDFDTLTLRGPDNSMMVVRVDGGHRRDAAPFLGKSVTVHFQNHQGECRLIKLGASR